MQLGHREVHLGYLLQAWMISPAEGRGSFVWVLVPPAER